MYGLLLDSIQKFLCERYGEQYWDRIRRRANLQNHWFVTHEVYSDDVLLDLVNAAAIELGEENGTVMRMFGEYFAKSIGHYGYARLLRVLGRDLRDFLNGLDDLHEYLRFSYPKMCSPSFFCESETEEGLILHYTTKRKGYIQYVIGQLTTVGRIYGKDVEVRVLSEEIAESGTRPIHITMELKFDNSELSMQKRVLSPVDKDFSISADTFLGVFPFCILFNKDLIICREGTKLMEVLPNLVGRHLGECFTVQKPMIDAFSWKIISLHANSVFELVSRTAVEDRKAHIHPTVTDSDEPHLSFPPQLRLKGQMLALPNMEVMAFLCSPVMDSPEELYASGIYVNDLSMHDSSRDMILAGSQKDPELKIALSQEKIRSAQLEDSIQQTDRLLFQMIPKPIADQLRNGETPLNTCREFSSVSILFSDIVSFTPMCSRLHPMEVVCVLNAMCVAFDRLCETHHVYKVETVGDAYMVICGAPVSTVYHAEYVTAFGLNVIQATSKINDPSTGQSVQVRVGIHSGNIVAGVVGSTVLRYGVFGDTVNVAARMEATGQPMKVHISEATAQFLVGSSFTLEARGIMEVKGKGAMSTYWVTDKTAIEPLPATSPSRPIRQAAVLPIIQQLETPKVTSTPLESPFIHSRSLGPKPHEWPRADKQLQKFSSLSPVATDYSVPPGATRNRRNTEPRPPQLHLSCQSSAPATRAKARRHTEPKPPPHAHFTRQSSPQQQALFQPIREPATCHSPPQELSHRLLAPKECPLKQCTTAKMNACAKIEKPTSFCAPLFEEMQQFAIQAEKSAQQIEENTRQARHLAEWANSIACQLKTVGLPSQISQSPGKMNDKQEGFPNTLEGTSVDPGDIEYK